MIRAVQRKRCFTKGMGMGAIKKGEAILVPRHLALFILLVEMSAVDDLNRWQFIC
jgi:hypothetical protein